MDDEVIDIHSERATPINADPIFPESRDENVKSQGCRTIVLRCVKVATVLSLLVVIIILAVYWLNGHTLLAEFSFQKENVRTPVFICIEVFLAVIVLISLADILKKVIEWVRNRRKYTSLLENDTRVETGVWTGIRFFSSKFTIRESLDSMQFQALAEIGLLTKQACRMATEATQRDRDRPDAVRSDEYNMSLSNGIAFQGGAASATALSVPVTTLITGTKKSGKTSIFNRLMYGGFSEVKPDTIGLNFGLKTLTIDGPNMFNERKVLDIEAQILDCCIRQEDIYDYLPFAFGNNVILVIVCDANDPSSIESVGPLTSQLRVRGLQFHASVFVNKVDEAGQLGDIRARCYPALGGVDLFEVSAKTGDGINESFIRVISKAVSIEAKNAALDKER